MIERLVRAARAGLFMSVRPGSATTSSTRTTTATCTRSSRWTPPTVRINGGFFVIRTEIFDDFQPDEDIMDDGARLADGGDLVAYRYDGFWAPMDTIKDKQDLDAIVESGKAPWQIVRAAPLVMLGSRSQGRRDRCRRVLAIGCHADDIEIGCGGTILALSRQCPMSMCRGSSCGLGRARGRRLTRARPHS